MNITHGMDATEVEELGRFLQSRADHLNQIVQQINRAVYGIPWEGGVAIQFGQQHWPGHRARLQDAARGLHGLGQSALHNASEQRSVSAVRGADGRPRSGGVARMPRGGSSADDAWAAAGFAIPLGQLVVAFGELGGSISQGRRLGRFFEAKWALERASTAAERSVAGARVGGLTTQLRGHAGISKLGAVGTVLDVADFGLSGHAKGFGDGETLDKGVAAIGTVVAGRVVPGGDLAWKVGYDVLGKHVAKPLLDAGSMAITGDDLAGNLFTGAYVDRDMTDPVVAAEVSQRAANPFLCTWDVARGAGSGLTTAVRGWFR